MDAGLKIGDYVTLRALKFESYLGAEGILNDGLVVHNRVSEFDDCIFCVHLQRQYSAANELETFRERNASILEIDEDERDDSVKMYVNALQRGNKNEITLNDSYLKLKVGQPVHFADVIQLYHVKSRKYLVVNPKQLATSERENSRLSLSVRGNAYSWLKFLPRSRIDREGDRIIANTDCYIAIAERNNEFVHVAEVSPKDGFDRDVNCSLEKSSWRLGIYQNCLDVISGPSNLLSSQLVYLNDPETFSNLTVATPEIASFDNVAIPSSGVEEDSTSTESEYFHSDGDIISKPISEGKENAAAVWIIESRSLVGGGPFQWKTEQVRFRHLVSGRYLAVVAKTVDLGSVEDGAEVGVEGTARPPATPMLQDSVSATETMYYLTTVDSTGLASPGTSFDVREQAGSNNFLTKSKALTISTNEVYLTRGDELENDQFSIKLTPASPGPNPAADALNLLINVYVPLSEQGQPEDAPKSLEPIDVHSGHAARKHLSRFLQMTTLPKTPQVNTVMPSATPSDVAFFAAMAEKVMNFSQGFDMSATNVTIGVDNSDPSLKFKRQCLLRDFGVIEIVLRMIHRLIFVTEKMASEKLTDAETAMTEQGSFILNLCFKMVYFCVLDNPEIQIYVATFLKTLLMHLSTQPFSGKCVTEMLSKNLELQETKIGEPEISIFVDSLKSSTMNGMYLNLLQCCCSCEGQGVDGNQCTVADTLFDKAEEVLLFLVVDDQQRIKISWVEEGATSIFITDTADDVKPIMGHSLVTQGLPMLYVTWTNPDEEWTPHGLYGREKVALMDIFPQATPSVSKSDSNFNQRSAAASSAKLILRKQAVANYFISEMFLGAEMCMDRNYVAMHKLDPLFTFDALVTIMKMDNVNDVVKAAAARLLLCLHVDRDPQAETKIPVLTRTWSSIRAASSSPQLPNVELNRQYTFGLIQQLVSEHLEDMAGKKWNSYSKYMLQMLLSMIKFNFYGSLERMNFTIKPVIEAVDRRNVVGPDSNQSSMRRADGGLERRASVSLLDADGGGSVKIAAPVEPREPWQRRTLDFFESIPVMIFILTLVLVAVSITIYEVVDEIEEDKESPIFIWGLCVFSIFVIDYSTRFYCYVWINGKVWPFVSEIFNIIDITVISLDVIFLALPSGSGNGNLTKTLRLVRLARLLRVARAVKVINSMVEASTKRKKKVWVMPQRYLKCTSDEIDTIRQSLDVLLFIQGVIDDRNLSLLLRHFYKWIEVGGALPSPDSILDKVAQESTSLTLGIADFDYIFVDIIMYVDVQLVQSALDVIIAHNSLRHKLLENASQVQLLVTPKREQQFKQIEAMLQQLERNAETHELWGELEDDAHHEQNVQTKEILVQLTKLCRTRCFVLEFGEDFLPDKEIQNLYRNLGCFTICFKMLGLLESVGDGDENGELGEVARNTQELCRMTNELLYWFFIDNPQNQELGFSELEFFLDSLDSSIKSHHIVRAIFKNNESLMTIVPLSILTDLGEKIEIEKSHTFLSLGCNITNVGDKNIVKNQFEIVRTLTGPERYAKVAWGLVPITHPEYTEKRELMGQVDKDIKDPSVDDLPPLLAYHLTLLETLSNCTVGRLNITSAEAKIQSIFPLVDVIASILDQDTILVAKLRMTQFLLNAIVDVEMVVPGLCQSASMWRLLDSFVGVLEYARDDFRLVEKVGWESPQVSRHKAEHIMTCIMVCYSFFDKNYDPSKVKSEDGVSGADTVIWPMAQINGIVVSLFRMVKDVYDLDSPRLSVDHKKIIYDAMIAMNNSALQPVIAGEIEATHLLVHGEEEELDVDVSHEKDVLGKYREFLDQLKGDSEVQKKTRTENLHFIEVVEALPSSTDSMVVSDVRYEAFIQKLIRHTYENITMANGEKKINARCTASTIWIVKVFRTMIENKMGMTIYERDDDGGEEQDVAAAPVVAALNENGATALCLDLIATGVDEALQNEAIKLVVGMLFKEGGAIEVQGTVNTYLMKTDSTIFFKQVCSTIQKLRGWHEWQGVIFLEEGQEPEPPENILIIRFLQLLSEGHYLPNQDIMRTQPNNKVTHNILDELVSYLNSLSRIQCRTSTNCAIRVSATILEVIQGPSVGNQEHLALNTELLEVMNRLMHANVMNDCDEGEEVELKMTIVGIYKGLFEGAGPKSLIVERLLSVIHIDVIFMLAKPWKPPPVEEGITPEEPPTDDMLTLKIGCGVLFNVLCDFKPSLRDDLVMDEKDNDGSTTSIEVSWDGVLNRRFFHTPDVCSLLAKSSKDALVADVDRSNNENKLIDFLARAADLYKEVKHQEKLVQMGISGVFSRENQQRVSSASFLLCVVINVLYLSFYIIDVDTQLPVLPDNVTIVIDVLNVIQIVGAVVSAIINFVVNSPVIAWKHQEAGCSNFEVALYTATDGMTLYYLWYLSFSVLGMAYDNMFIIFLLLDIVAKNATTRDILNAVLYPWKQLVVAFILGIFIIYIFTFFIVS